MPQSQPQTCQQAEQPDCPEGPSFRKTPWFILRDPNVKGNGTSLVLSVIWAAVQGRGDGSTYCKITKEEIARRSGIRGKAQEVRRHLVKLEKIGYIKRHGAHKNRTIELLLANPPDTNGLIIDPDILQLDFSPTEKLLIAITRAFPGCPIKWKCEHLSISKWTYHTKLQRIEKTNPNVFKKLSQRIEKTNSLLDIDSIGLSTVGISKDIPGKPQACHGQFMASSAIKEEPPPPYRVKSKAPSKKESQAMPLKIAYCTTIEQDRLNAIACAVRLRREDAITRGYSATHVDELEYIREFCPFIHVPGNNTKGYSEDIGTVMALINGPGRVLPRHETEAMLEAMTTKILVGAKEPLSRERIDRWFLQHHFTDDERQALYDDVNKSCSATYGGRGRKIRLSEAMRSHRNYSLLVQLWLVPLHKAKDEMPRDLCDYRRQYDMATELTPEHMAQWERVRLAWNIRGLRLRYLNELKGMLPAGHERLFYNDWPNFFLELHDFFDRQGTQIYPGWFSPRSRPVESFLAGAGISQAGCPRPDYNKKEEAGCAQG